MIKSRIIVQTDANILIDLIKLGLLEQFFDLKFSFHITIQVFQELYPIQQNDLNSNVNCGELHVDIIPPEQNDQINTVKMKNPQLSFEDISSFSKAVELGAILLTSDNKLRKYSETNGLTVHGHLWVFGQMVKAETISPLLACNKLIELNHINPKLNLPEEECEIRITRWQKLGKIKNNSQLY